MKNTIINKFLLLILMIGLNSCENDSGINTEELWITYPLEGLEDEIVRVISVDSNNNIWIGTSHGLLKFNELDWEVYTDVNSIRDITIDNKNVLWVASSNIWAESTPGVHTFDGTNWTTQIGNKSVSTIAIDKNGNKWIGTGGAQLIKYNNDTLLIYPEKYIDHSGIGIKSIEIDTYDNKWIGSDAGVLKFDSLENWTYYSETGNYAPAVKMDTNNNVWAGTNNGLYKYDGVSWTSYNEEDGLIYHMINCLTIDKDDNIWIGTHEGLSVFNGLEWRTLLKDEYIFSITVDNKGSIWIGCNKKILKYIGT